MTAEGSKCPSPLVLSRATECVTVLLSDVLMLRVPSMVIKVVLSTLAQALSRLTNEAVSL